MEDDRVKRPETPEAWRPVVGLEGLYEVSSHARIRSVERLVTQGGRPRLDGARRTRMVRPAIRTATVLGSGYVGLSLATPEGGERCVLLHRAVCEAFNGPPPFPGALCRHSDDNKANNLPENLRWGTALDNAADAIRNGKQVRGQRHGRAKLTSLNVEEIRRQYRRYSQEFGSPGLALRYGVSERHILQIVRATRWA